MSNVGQDRNERNKGGSTRRMHTLWYLAIPGKKKHEGGCSPP